MTNISIYELRLVKEGKEQYNVDEQITNPETAVKIINKIFDLENKAEEEMIMMTLDNKNKATGLFKISKGTINSTIVHPREIFKRAVLHNANCIMIFHNHPSGNLEPSQEDIKITNRLADSGTLLRIKLLDHIIISREGHLSFKGKKLL